MIIHALAHALSVASSMGWEILWPLILGFLLSAAIQAVVSHRQMSRLLPDDKPRTLALASGLGAASSSCSYAAVAIARSIFRKGANFTAAMAFEIASTNLVIELGIIIVVLLGWQFAAAEFLGGPLMIIALAILFKKFLTPKLVQVANAQAEKGLVGRMEGHAEMDMSVSGDNSIIKKLVSKPGRISASHYFVMDWASIWVDIALGLVIAGAIAAWVPQSFFEQFFFSGHPLISSIWGPLIGPLIAVISFVCSVGNIPLAVVLWNGGLSFGGVVAFIFADLITIPILLIYRKYYGTKMMLFLFGMFYAAMAIAGYLVEILFAVFHLTANVKTAQVLGSSFSWNYTTFLNIAFLILATVMLWIFVRSKGSTMIKNMNVPQTSHAPHCH